MIIKDVPESESSTDPVKQFEELHPPASIDSIQEDQEEASDSECKDQSLSNLALATNPPHSSHPLPSPSSSDRSPEIPHREEDSRPLMMGLAAPDSKDSLEVQLTSACEDLSESQISGKGSLDETQQRIQESSDSEEEHQPTVNERSASEDAGRRTSISDFVLEEDLKARKSISDFVFEEEKAQTSQAAKIPGKIELVETDVTTETSDDDFEIVTKKEVSGNDWITLSSTDEVEFALNEPKDTAFKDETSTENDRETKPPLIALLESTYRPEKLESIPSTDTEPRQSRPSSSDYSDIYRQREEDHDSDSSDDEKDTEIIKTNEQRIESASSDYSEGEQKKLAVQTIDSSDFEKEEEKGQYIVRKSSASSAISDATECKTATTVESSSEYDQEVIKTEYYRDPEVKGTVRKSSASSAISDVAEQTLKATASSSSETDQDIINKEKEPATKRTGSVSSGYSDIVEKKPDYKEVVESSDTDAPKEKKENNDASSSASEEEDKLVQNIQPRKSSVSFAIPADISDEKALDSMDFVTITVKPIQTLIHDVGSEPAMRRAESASSGCSDIDKVVPVKELVAESSDTYATMFKKKTMNSSSCSDEEGELVNIVLPKKTSVSSAASKKDTEESTDSEEVEDIVKVGDPRAPSASSDYSDLGEKKLEGITVIDSSDIESETTKHAPRKSSASSVYSDTADKKVQPVVDSSSDYDCEPVKLSGEPKIKTQESSDFEKEAEFIKPSPRPISSDYSDFDLSKSALTRKQSAPARPYSSDYSDLDAKKEEVTRKYSENIRKASASSDYSDLEVKKEESVKPIPRPISSDYSDLDVSKPGLSRKQSAPARPYSSDYSDLDVMKEQVTRKYSENIRQASASSDYSDLEVKKEEPKRTASVSSVSSYSDVDKKAAAADSSDNDEDIEPGIIQVVVHKAADLVNQEIMGKSDPYVVIKFRGQEFRSQTVNNTINPEWNFSTDLLISKVYDSNINIEVFDDDSGLDSCEGILVLSLADAIKRSSEEGRWYSLSNCKHGRIFVSCIYTAMPAPSQPGQSEATPRTRTYSSSSSEEEVTKDQNTVLQQSSSDSSISNNGRDKAKVKHQMAMDRASMDEDTESGKRGTFKPQSSSEYSDTDNERKGASGVESSSDYDSTPAQKRRKGPSSIISDTSSDGGSSAVGPRIRPLSQFLDDEYDVITEEEATETKSEKSEKKQNVNERSSSESEGPETKDAPAPADIIPEVQTSSVEDQEQGGDHNGSSLLPPALTPHPTLSSSVASNSAILSSDQHAEAEQTSVSLEVAKSSVINSNTLDEIGPLAEDHDNGLLSLTKQAEKTKEGTESQSTSRISSSTCSSIDQAQRDGSSESERSQGIKFNRNEISIF